MKNKQKIKNLASLGTRRTIILLVVMVMFIAFLPIVNATDWDNILDYTNEDKTIIITNWLGLGEEIGNATLISHKDPTIPINVFKGANRTVMFYEIDFSQDYEDAFGDVRFIDLKTEKSITKDYYFGEAIFSEHQVPLNYETTCSIENGTEVCNQEITQWGTEKSISGWEIISNYDILEKDGIRTIGLITDVDEGDYIDAVWKIGGKYVKRHASWNESFTNGLTNYYKLDETSGTIAVDSVGGNNLNHNATNVVNANGKINGGAYYGGAKNYSFSSSNGNAVVGSGSWTVSLWANASTGAMWGEGTTTQDQIVTLTRDSAIQVSANTWGSNPAWSQNNTANLWTHYVESYDGTTLRVYQNGTQLGIFSGSPLKSLNIASAPFTLGRVGNYEIDSYVTGYLDEVGIWNRVLSQSEITDLYNGGAGMTYMNNSISLTTNLISPADSFSSSNTSITFSANATSLNGNILNMTLYLWNGGQVTNLTTGLNGTFNLSTWTMNNLVSNNYIWNALSCASNSSASICVWGINRTLIIDFTPPSITLNAPINTLNYWRVGTNESINWTITGSPNTCWFEYNGTNNTRPCADSNSTFALIQDMYNITMWANDSANNLAGNTSNWNYYIVGINETFNNLTIESTAERFETNVKLNTTLSSVNLLYNGTSYGGTITSLGSGVYRILRNLNIPLVNADTNKTFYWNFNRADGIIVNSTSQTQQTDNLIFSNCNATLTRPYLNISFRDEGNNSIINATIPSATFVYWVNDTTLNQTFSFTNTTEMQSFAFCSTPNRSSFNMDYILEYKSTNYPQRIWNPSTTFFSNTTLNQTLYLLYDADGIYVTFQVINSAQQSIQGVIVSANVTIGGSPQTINIGTTDSAGSVTVWLNPNALHDFLFEATAAGYEDYTTSFYPTQSTYTITLGGLAQVTNDYGQGIIPTFAPPSNVILYNNTAYLFQFNLTSSFWTVTEFGFRLYNQSGSQLNFTSAATNGGSTSVILNVGNYTQINMNAYYIVDGGNYTNFTRLWYIQNSGGLGFGLRTFFNNLSTYLTSGLFGLDNFGLAVLSFLFIFVFTGIVSYQYGITSPAAISALVFSLVAFLDVGLGLLDGLRPFGTNFPVPTILVGIVMIGFMIKEVYQ